MKQHIALAVAALCLAAVSPSMGQTQASKPTASASATLYRSFGEKEGLTLLMDDFVNRLVADPRIGARFKSANLEHLKQQLTEQLCQLAGGPCVYQGPDMATAHSGMGIGKGDFNALVEDLQQAMEARSIPFSAQNQMLARLAPMHREIIAP